MKRKSTGKGRYGTEKKSGEIFPKLLSISAVANPQGLVTHYVGIFSDISKIKQTEMNLERLAHFDPLTGLANRVLFRDRLRQALLKADRTGDKVAVLFLDLDGFKHINDTLGHPVGDKLLNAVGKRLLDCVRKSDTVARLGGDEFTLVLTDFVDTRNIDFIFAKDHRPHSRSVHPAGSEDLRKCKHRDIYLSRRRAQRRSPAPERGHCDV